MIQTLITMLDVATGPLGIAEHHGLVQMVSDGDKVFPALNRGKGNFTKPATDSKGTWSYWRQTSPEQFENVNTFSCTPGMRGTYSLRYVAMIDRDGPCQDVSGALGSAVANMRGRARAIRQAVEAMSVGIVRASPDADSDRVFAAELGSSGMTLPPRRALVAIDIQVVITADDECFDSCNSAPYDPCADCPPGEACPYSGVVNIDGVQAATFGPFDPCENNTLNINITYS